MQTGTSALLQKADIQRAISRAPENYAASGTFSRTYLFTIILTLKPDSVLAEVDRGISGGAEMKSKGAITRARETVAAAGKGAAQRTKLLAGEVASAAATAGAAAKAASTAAASAVLGTVATAIETRAAKGANAVAHVGGPTTSTARKKVAKRMGVKKRAAATKKANTKKKTSRKAAKKSRV